MRQQHCCVAREEPKATTCYTTVLLSSKECGNTDDPHHTTSLSWRRLVVWCGTQQTLHTSLSRRRKTCVVVSHHYTNKYLPSEARHILVRFEGRSPATAGLMPVREIKPSVRLKKKYHRAGRQEEIILYVDDKHRGFGGRAPKGFNKNYQIIRKLRRNKPGGCISA